MSCSNSSVLKVSKARYSRYSNMHATIGYGSEISFQGSQVAIRYSEKAFHIVLNIYILGKRLGIRDMYKESNKARISFHLQGTVLGAIELG